MKTLELTKQQVRHLVMSLEASGKGFNIGQFLLDGTKTRCNQEHCAQNDKSACEEDRPAKQPG